MRTAAILLIGFFGAAAAVLPARAVPALGPGIQPSTSAAITEAAGRCGPHAYYVRRHRGMHGRWIPGHCVLYRRYRHHP